MPGFHASTADSRLGYRVTCAAPRRPGAGIRPGRPVRPGCAKAALARPGCAKAARGHAQHPLGPPRGPHARRARPLAIRVFDPRRPSLQPPLSRNRSRPAALSRPLCGPAAPTHAAAPERERQGRTRLRLCPAPVAGMRVPACPPRTPSSAGPAPGWARPGRADATAKRCGAARVVWGVGPAARGMTRIRVGQPGRRRTAPTCGGRGGGGAGGTTGASGRNSFAPPPPPLPPPPLAAPRTDWPAARTHPSVWNATRRPAAAAAAAAIVAAAAAARPLPAHGRGRHRGRAGRRGRRRSGARSTRRRAGPARRRRRRRRRCCCCCRRRPP
jgi:hypothetical protein